jgi:FkbM family methyltransferase
LSTSVNQVTTSAIAPPDSWLYSRATLAWMFNPALTQQLPWLYQFFRLYCQIYFQLTNDTDLRGGRRLFQWLSGWLKQWSPQRYLNFHLPNYEVFLDPFDARFLQVVNELTQADADTQVLAHLLKLGDTFIDVGANHGSFAIVASKLVGATGLVIAVEPQPRLAQAVTQSLAANALGKYQVYPVAVGNEVGEVELLLPQGTSGSAGIYAAHSGTHGYEVVRVPLQRFADLVAGQSFPGRVVIKLDVEGSEMAFLAGAKPLIVSLKPALIIEIHPGTLQAAQTTAAELLQCLQGLGYTHYAEMQPLESRRSLAHLDTTIQRNVVLFMT